MTDKITLANFWHPIAESKDVTHEPRRFQLLGTDLVAFRGDDGNVAVFKDLCIHRGTALSLGWVENGNIVCPYHGWSYDRTGACVRIPSLPEGTPIPPKAKAIAYQCEERYGLVWATLAEPMAPIPAYPNNENDDTDFHLHVTSHNVVRTSAGRAVENFMDFSHFPFVHPNLLAPPERTVVPALEIEETDYGLKYSYETIETESPSSKESVVVQFEYYYYRPFTVHVRKVTPDGGVTYISEFAAPTSEDWTHLYLVFCRNYERNTPDSEFDHFSNRVVEQDRRIMESQRPEQIPTDLREELHLRVPDKVSINLRRLLAGIGVNEGYMP